MAYVVNEPGVRRRHFRRHQPQRTAELGDYIRLSGPLVHFAETHAQRVSVLHQDVLEVQRKLYEVLDQIEVLPAEAGGSILKLSERGRWGGNEMAPPEVPGEWSCYTLNFLERISKFYNFVQDYL